MGVSCDSFNPDTNAEIGRTQGTRNEHVHAVMRVREWYRKYQVRIVHHRYCTNSMLIHVGPEQSSWGKGQGGLCVCRGGQVLFKGQQPL